MSLQRDGALPQRREWWQTGNAAFFGLMALSMIALSVWGSVFVLGAIWRGSAPLNSPLVVGMLAILQALLFFIGLLLLFAAASQWDLARQSDWEWRMNFMWVPVFLLMFALVGTLAVTAPSALGLGLAALLGGFLWWERPDAFKAWMARRGQARLSRQS